MYHPPHCNHVHCGFLDDWHVQRHESRNVRVGSMTYFIFVAITFSVSFEFYITSSKLMGVHTKTFSHLLNIDSLMSLNQNAVVEFNIIPHQCSFLKVIDPWYTFGYLYQLGKQTDKSKYLYSNTFGRGQARHMLIAKAVIKPDISDPSQTRVSGKPISNKHDAWDTIKKLHV